MEKDREYYFNKTEERRRFDEALAWIEEYSCHIIGVQSWLQAIKGTGRPFNQREVDWLVRTVATVRAYYDTETKDQDRALRQDIPLVAVRVLDTFPSTILSVNDDKLARKSLSDFVYRWRGELSHIGLGTPGTSPENYVEDEVKVRR